MSAGAEPVPFIGDDLFASFDDARAGHGVEALANLPAMAQPILFTHHRHVADIARARLGEGVDVIELWSVARGPDSALQSRPGAHARLPEIQDTRPGDAEWTVYCPHCAQ